MIHKLAKKTVILFITVLSAILFYSCSASETATYNAGNNENWKINVVHIVGAVDHFKVLINDSTVIDKRVNAVTSKLEEKGSYRDREVKLVVSYTQESYGSGYFDAIVYIENKLAAKFKF
jgi:hypothetical protein